MVGQGLRLNCAAHKLCLMKIWNENYYNYYDQKLSQISSINLLKNKTTTTKKNEINKKYKPKSFEEKVKLCLEIISSLKFIEI